MPKTTQVIHWRARRQRRRQRSGQAVLKIAGLLLLVGLLVGLFGMIGSVGAVTAVYAYFTQDLPDFTQLEALGQNESDTFETSKIYAWGRPPARRNPRPHPHLRNHRPARRRPAVGEAGPDAASPRGRHHRHRRQNLLDQPRLRPARHRPRLL
ncbi:MAG: hypothetical protein IPH82_05065 [Chloroflexi bacterium]|nr:hypothetical protein [Chloroflexota bacterium]